MELICPAGVIAQTVDHQRDVAIEALADRLAIVERFESGQLLNIAFDEVGQLVDEATAIAGIHLAPGFAFKGFAGGSHSHVDIVTITFSHVSDHILGGWVVGSKSATAESVHPLAADQVFGLCCFNRRFCAFIQGCSGHNR